MVKPENKIQSGTSKAMAATSPAAANKKKYKGVRMRSWGSWVSEIRAPNQKVRIWLGSYSTPEAAARAYDAALLCLKGSSANLNFPITSSHYIPDTVMSPKSIQKVAAAAANSFMDNAAAATASSPTPATPSESSPPLPSSFSSSPSPSSSISSTFSDQLDEDVSLVQSLGSYSETIPMLDDSWYNFEELQSPKFLDQVLNPPMTMMDDFYEGDIRLWSFAE